MSLNMICSQKQATPAADEEIASADVAAAAVKEVKRLQQDVDRKLLVSSGGKGPPARQRPPAKKVSKARVSVHNLVFVHAHVARLLSLCVHIHSVQKPSVSQPLPLVLEAAGSKRTSSASPSMDPAPQTRSPHPQSQVSSTKGMKFLNFFLESFQNFLRNLSNFS